MKFRHAISGGDEKIELQMVPMIDIVFQLLIFFVMTFNPSVPEGDFSITMPINAPSDALPDEDLQLPIHVHLVADDDGNLTNIRVNQQVSYGSGDAAFVKLRSRIIEEVNRGSATGSSSYRESGEVEFETDFNLKYGNLIRAITAVTGHRDDEGRLVKLMQKIKFVPQKKKQKAAE